MLFGNADVKAAVGMGCGEFVYARAARHRSSYRADFRVAIGQLGERFAKNILIGGRSAARSLVLLAGDHIKFGDAMIFVVGCFCRGIAFALLRHDMDEYGAFGIVADIFEDGNKLV